MKMRYITSIICFLSILLMNVASTPTAVLIADYVQKHQQTAVKEMRRSGIPASILLAQAILASEQGTTAVSAQGHNHFAVKCGAGWAGETRFDKVAQHITETCFRAYEDAEKSFTDYTNMIMETRSCRNLFQFSYYDYKSWAHGMQACFHADNPKYAAQLIKLIERYDLEEFDTPMSFSPIITQPIIGYEYEID